MSADGSHALSLVVNGAAVGEWDRWPGVVLNKGEIARRQLFFLVFAGSPMVVGSRRWRSEVNTQIMDEGS